VRYRSASTSLEASDATSYIGHETIIAKNGGIQRVPEAISSYLNRNAVHEERRYGMPAQQVVEIGTQIYLRDLESSRLELGRSG